MSTHASLEAVFNEPWARLDTVERRALASLAVFPADFSLEAGAAVADASRQGVSGWADKSLLQVASEWPLDLREMGVPRVRDTAGAAGLDRSRGPHVAW